MDKNYLFKKLSGFTLVEILISVSIIAFLSSFVVASLQVSKEKARNVRRVADANQIATAIELYRNDNNDTSPGEDGTEYINGDPNWIPGLAPKFIAVVPSDPLDAGDYKYHYLRQGVNYEVAAFMEQHGNDATCNDGGPSGCDYYEKAHGDFLAVFNPGASGWNLASSSVSPTPAPTPPPPPPVDPTVVVLYPNGGENFTSGQTVVIRWTWDEPNRKSADFSIWLSKRETSGIHRNQLKIAEVTSNIGENSYSWIIPGGYIRTDYDILVTSKSYFNFPSLGGARTAYDYSDSTFSIAETVPPVSPPPSPPPADTTAPTISNIQVTNITQTSASFSWATSELTTDIFYYSQSSPLSITGASKIEGISALTSHGVSLSGLTASTTYFFLIVSKDAAGNTTTSSEWSFATLSPPLPSPPPPSVMGCALNLKWSLQIGPSGISFYSAPAVASDGTIYAGSSDKNLYAINPDGTVKWKFYLGNAYYVYSSPAIASDGTIYIASPDGNFYAVNPNGTKKWSYSVGFPSTSRSSPAIASDGTIYIGSGNNLYALNSDGTLKWSFATGGRIDSSPAIGTDGTVYFGSIDRNFYALNPDGIKKWSYAVGSIISAPPAIGSDGTIYAGVQNAWPTKGGLYAFSPQGSKKWFFTPTDYQAASAGDTNVFYSPVIGTDGTIYISTAMGNFHAVTPDGAFKWRFTASSTPSQQNSGVAVGSDGTIYFGYDKLYAVDGNSNFMCAYQKPSASNYVNSDPAITGEGVVYFGASDGKFYAINGTGAGLAGSAWPKYHKNLLNTGASQ